MFIVFLEGKQNMNNDILTVSIISDLEKITSKALKAKKFLRGIYFQTIEKKTLINKRKTSKLFNISEFCFIISLYSYGLIFLPVNLKHYVYDYTHTHIYIYIYIYKYI